MSTQQDYQISPEAQEALNDLPPSEQQWLNEALEGKHTEYISGENEPLPLPTESPDIPFNLPEYGDQYQQPTAQPVAQPAAQPVAEQPPPQEGADVPTKTDPEPDPRDVLNSQLVRENYQLRTAARKSQDSDEVNAFTDRVKANLVAQNAYTPEQIDDISNGMKLVTEDNRAALRWQDNVRDAAFSAGRQFNLTMEQVETLAGSPNADTFQKTFDGFNASAPTAREVALQNQINDMSKELAAVKQQVVPPNQQFGSISGAAVPGENKPDPSTFFSDLLSGRLGVEDDVLAKTDSLLADIYK